LLHFQIFYVVCLNVGRQFWFIHLSSFKSNSCLVAHCLSFTAALSASKRRKRLYQDTHSYDTVNFNVMLVNYMQVANTFKLLHS
jgi:hypothetical protein